MDDMLFDSLEFILEIATGTPGGVIQSYSMDGAAFDHPAISLPQEISYVFVS